MARPLVAAPLREWAIAAGRVAGALATAIAALGAGTGLPVAFSSRASAFLRRHSRCDGVSLLPNGHPAAKISNPHVSQNEILAPARAPFAAPRAGELALAK